MLNTSVALLVVLAVVVALESFLFFGYYLPNTTKGTTTPASTPASTPGRTEWTEPVTTAFGTGRPATVPKATTSAP